MKMNNIIAGALCSAALALQCWTLNEIVNLKVEIATLNTQLASHLEKIVAYEP